MFMLFKDWKKNHRFDIYNCVLATYFVYACTIVPVFWLLKIELRMDNFFMDDVETPFTKKITII